jgi:hypothetical protein
MTSVFHQQRQADPKFLATLPILGKPPASAKEEAYLREMGKFQFYNMEEPGHSEEFGYGNTKVHTMFHLEHGKTYPLPRHVQRHVESLGTPIYRWIPDGQGSLMKQIAGEKQRFQLKQVYEE